MKKIFAQAISLGENRLALLDKAIAESRAKQEADKNKISQKYQELETIKHNINDVLNKATKNDFREILALEEIYR